MRMPGFTAEAALYNRSACRYRTGGHVAASTDGAGILPAMRRESVRRHSMISVYGLCNACGGVYGPPSETNNTYSCVCPGGRRGIVCGGDGDDEKGVPYADTCDLWGGGW